MMTRIGLACALAVAIAAPSLAAEPVGVTATSVKVGGINGRKIDHVMLDDAYHVVGNCAAGFASSRRDPGDTQLNSHHRRGSRAAPLI
jgi:hypothetical protein